MKPLKSGHKPQRECRNDAGPFYGRGPEEWQIFCGVRGAETKYLETYKVLGNQRRTGAIQRQYSEKLIDKSYTTNAREVSLICAGLYE